MLAGCAAGTPAPEGAPAATADAGPSGSAAPSGPEPGPSAAGPAAPKTECAAFMEVVARTTTLRAAIQTEAPTAAKAEGWAAQSAQIAADASALPLANPDLIVENAGLATRLGELTKDLRALATAEKGGDPAKKAAAHRRVLNTSEQVEVLTREPAARCAGDTKKLIATSGRLPASAIQRVLRDRLPLAQRCYEAGLARDPKLTGRVLVRFVIGADGKVTEAGPAGADAARTADVVTPGDAPAPPMPDAKVAACVVDVVRGAAFPAPDGGAVTVVYPFTFSRSP